MLKRPQTRTGQKLLPWLVPAAAFALLGCPNEDLAPLEPCTVSGVSDDIPVTGVDKVDLLFVIDNSKSMREEQAKLSVELPNLVTILTTGDLDADGKQDFQPVSDLHLGVISSDMGASGTAGAPTCDKNNNFGDDGVLISTSRAPTGDPCAGVGLGNTRYMTFVPGMGQTAEQVANSFKCIATLGIDGCGFEQQLEAMYKALAPNNVAFGKGTGGHGNEKNNGFLRPEAVLAVIQVSDEEDCSITDNGADLFITNSNSPNVLLPSGERIGLNLRCGYKSEDPNLVHPVERYINGLLQLKPQNQDHIIFAAIVGIPLEMEGKPFQEILDHPGMVFKPDMNSSTGGDPTDNATPATPVCLDVEGTEILTSAVPGRRFVATAAGFNTNGVVRSICAKSYAPALDAILEKISQKLKGGCLPRALNPNKEGIVECDVVEVLPPNATAAGCQAQRGRQFLEMRKMENGETRAVCKINQVGVVNEMFKPSPTPLMGVNALTGWFYDNFTESALTECPMNTPQRISFVSNGTDFESAKPQGTTVRFECFQPVARSDSEARGKDAANSPCESDADCAARSDSADLISAGKGFGLVCEPESKTCQIRCQVDSNCPASWVCETQSMLCVNPTCPPPTLN